MGISIRYDLGRTGSILLTSAVLQMAIPRKSSKYFYTEPKLRAGDEVMKEQRVLLALLWISMLYMFVNYFLLFIDKK